MRIGLIGAGRIGIFHGHTLAAHPEVTGLLVSDPARDRAEALASDVNGRVAPDAEAIVGDIDAMVIAAATDVHAPMMLLAANAGIRLL